MICCALKGKINLDKSKRVPLYFNEQEGTICQCMIHNGNSGLNIFYDNLCDEVPRFSIVHENAEASEKAFMMDFAGGIQLFFPSFAIEQVLDRSDDQVTLNLDISVVIITLSLQFIFCFLVSMKIIMSSLKDPMNFLIFCKSLKQKLIARLLMFSSLSTLKHTSKGRFA